MYTDDEETQFICRTCKSETDREDESPDTFVCEYCYGQAEEEYWEDEEEEEEEK